jgi:predicted dithiol-disulfide oxidoreductase (DUF899 family)
MTTSPSNASSLARRPPVVDLATWESVREELPVREKAHTHEGDAIAASQGQCEGCTMATWHLKDAVYLNARGVSFAVLTTGPWEEVARFVEFMGYTQPWYSVRGVEAPVGGDMGYIACFLREGDRVFLTYSTTGRGNEAVSPPFALLDMTPYGRGETWQDNPEAPAEVGHQACWYWRSDADGVATWGPTSRPVPQWTRPGATPVETLGRHGDHH